MEKAAITLGLVLGLFAGVTACAPNGNTHTNDQKMLSDLKQYEEDLANIELPTQFSDGMKSNFERRPEDTAKQYMRTFDSLENNGPVTKNRIQKIIQEKIAGQRASLIQKFLVSDLNGDGNISEEELERVRTYNNRSYTINFSDIRNSFIDDNRDGKVTMPEMLAYSRRIYTAQDSQTKNSSQEIYFMLFDLNEDGVVTRDEMFETLAEYLPERKENPLDKLKKNKTQNSDIKKSTKPNLTPVCTLPKIEKGTEIVTLSGTSSNTISPVAIAGQDQKAYASVLTIEPGDSDLYLLATSSFPTVWILKGEVSRVKTFVAQAAAGKGKPGVGVAGMDKDKIHFIDANCFEIYSTSISKQGFFIRGKIEKQLGREPDHVIGSTKLDEVPIPSGPVQEEQPRREIRVYSGSYVRLAKDTDKKVAKISLEDVVTRSPVKLYEVLPGYAGINQLINEGKLVQLGNSFHVIKPITRFPAGLNAEYILGKGIPMPEGKNRGTKVFSEETGEQIR